MMSVLLFRDDAYARTATARVVAVHERGIELDRTIFYPQGGGQMGDTGAMLRAAGEPIRIAGTYKGDAPDAVLQAAAPLPVWKVLKDAGLVSSTSEARRLIQQGGVEVDGQKVTDLAETVATGAHTVKLGKRRIYRVVLEGPKV